LVLVEVLNDVVEPELDVLAAARCQKFNVTTKLHKIAFGWTSSFVFKRHNPSIRQRTTDVERSPKLFAVKQESTGLTEDRARDYVQVAEQDRID
jgi:hypothetical protein